MESTTMIDTRGKFNEMLAELGYNLLATPYNYFWIDSLSVDDDDDDGGLILSVSQETPDGYNRYEISLGLLSKGGFELESTKAIEGPKKVTEKISGVLKKLRSKKDSAQIVPPTLDQIYGVTPDMRILKAVDFIDEFINLDISPTGQKAQESIDGARIAISKNSDGRMVWTGVYSNNFRDDDRPNEIISAKSHANFSDQVSKGDWPLPTLQIYHKEQYTIGTAEYTYWQPDEHGNGFSVAAGFIDPDAEFFAEALIEGGKSLAMSHSFYVLERDTEDPSIITKHRTYEVTILAPVDAANKITLFGNERGEKMTVKTVEEIQAEKESMAGNLGVPVDHFSTLDARLKAVGENARKLKDSKSQSKDGEADNTQAETDTQEEGATPPVPVDGVITIEQMPPEFHVLMQGMTDALEGMGKQLKSVLDAIDDGANTHAANEEKAKTDAKATKAQNQVAAYLATLQPFVAEKNSSVPSDGSEADSKTNSDEMVEPDEAFAGFFPGAAEAS